MSSSKKLTLSNKRLPYDLSVLSALVHVPTSTSSTVDFKEIYFSSLIYQTVRLVKMHILDFIQNEILTRNFDEDSPMEHFREYSVSDTVCAALRLWTTLVTVTAEAEENKIINKKSQNKNVSENDNESDNDRDNDYGKNDNENKIEMSNDISNLINVLFDITNVDGAVVCGIEVDGTLSRNNIYESAALCLIETIKLRIVGIHLSVEKWHRLGWIFLNTNDKIKKNALLALNTVIQTTAVHPRFLSYSCLLATDDVLAPLAEQGKSFYNFSFSSFRSFRFDS